VSIFLFCILFALAGFIQEVLITSYHRSVIAEKNVQASMLASSITIVSLLVIAGIIKKIFDPSSGLFSVLYVFVFATGKGLGAYGSLSWWSKKGACSGKGKCQRRN